MTSQCDVYAAPPRCDLKYKALMYPVAFIALCVYAVGVPLVFWRRLYKHREVLDAPGPTWMLGFLYRDYQQDLYYFECVELVRKFLLCGMLRFVEPGSATQIVVGIVFCVIYLSLLAYLTPYVDGTDDLFSTVCQVPRIT